MQSDEPEDRRGWHLDKRVNVGHLLTTVGLIVGVMVWGSKMESRIAVVENTVALQSNTTQKELSEIKDSLRRIEDKLERKADRR